MKRKLLKVLSLVLVVSVLLSFSATSAFAGTGSQKASQTESQLSSSASYYIAFMSMPLPLHGCLIMDKAGWQVIKNIMAAGGGATTIGFAVAKLCEFTIAPEIAAILGAILVVEYASVEVQFAMGSYVAYMYY